MNSLQHLPPRQTPLVHPMLMRTFHRGARAGGFRDHAAALHTHAFGNFFDSDCTEARKTMIRQFPTIQFLWRNRTCLLLAQQPQFNISSSIPPHTAILGTY